MRVEIQVKNLYLTAVIHFDEEVEETNFQA